MKRKVAAAMLFAFLLTLGGCSTQEQPQTETETTSAKNATESETQARPEYRALDYVTLGEYKGLEVTMASTEPTEEEIEERIQTELSQNNKLEEVTEGTVGETGTVNVDYVGQVDGEDIEGGTDKNVDITLGEANTISGFEEGDFGTQIGQAIADGLPGAQIGSEISVSVTFPETYEADAALAGKEAVFRVTVNSIKQTPELTDELVSEISDCTSVEEYRDQVKETLRSEKESAAESQKVNDLFAQIYSTSTIKEYPQDVVDYSMDTLVGYYEDFAEDAGQSFEEFLQQNFGQSEEEFREECMQVVEESLSQEMILMAIAETEDLTVSEGEYQEGLAQYAQDAGAESTEAYLETTSEEEVLRNLLLDKALAVVEDSAVIQESQETQVQAET